VKASLTGSILGTPCSSSACRCSSGACDTTASASVPRPPRCTRRR
jgi:hypothetical protein